MAHHFYLIDKEKKYAEEEVLFLIDLISAGKETELIRQSHETFGVDEAQLLRQMSGEGSLEGTTRFFIVDALSFTDESLQSLLKTLEEPVPNTVFIFIYLGASLLPQTILSRASLITGSHASGKNFGKDFVRKNIKDRMILISKISSSHEDDESSAPFRQEVKQYLYEIIHELKNSSLHENKNIVNEIIKYLDYLEFRGANPKMILERVALAV